MDLYKILGIRKNASPQSIKKAFRKKAKQTHPDISGDPEEFHTFLDVKTAYDVLSDPEKRKIYDETGRYDTKPSDSDISQAAQLIFTALRELIGRHKDKVVYTDIIQDIKKSFNNKIGEIQKAINEMKSIQAVLNDVSSRTVVDDGQFNYISVMLDSESDNIGRAVNENESQINMIRKCLEMLEHYHFSKKEGVFYNDRVATQVMYVRGY